MKSIFRISALILLIFILHSCKKDKPSPPVLTTPVLITANVVNISQFSATGGGTVTDGGGALSLLSGICWSKNETPEVVYGYNNNTYYTHSGVHCDAPCTFTCVIGGTPVLSANTTYYVRAFAESDGGIGYGNIVSFTTLSLPVIVPQTRQVNNITQTTALCGGSLLSNFDTTVKAKGICWSIAQNPSISDNKTTDGSGGGDFVSRLSGLTPNTTYYVNAYVTNNGGTGYGTVMSFKTLSTTVPGIITASVNSIAQTSAICGGTISSEGVTNITERGVCWSITQNPTISDNRTSDGTGPGDFVSSLTGLNPDTKYFLRTYATYSAGTAYGSELNFTTNGAVTDVDGNVYSTVTIGSQKWFAGNLKTTKYQDGSAVPFSTVSNPWGNLITAAYCWYNNDVSTYKNTYGALYNWYAVNTGKLCPAGWHIPSDVEWATLTDYLGGKSIAGGELKETGTTHWASPNTGATNKSGFSALPGGWRRVWPNGNLDNWAYYDEFKGIGSLGAWWSSNTGSYLRITSESTNTVGYKDYSSVGASVRCIRNN